jgi:cation diffusion facilitator CzcD-associated flavoprotein CzcO
VTQPVHGVVLAGDPDAANELLAAGINDFLIVDREVVSSVFDDDTDTWTLTTDDCQTCRGRVVIACESPLAPWIPDFPGRRDFRGTAMHAALPAAYFDPAGQRVAVIGADSSAGHLIDRMVAAGATVTVFPLPPRRAVPRLRRSIRFARRRRVEVITSPIEEVTPVGVRTTDGVHHDADALVYGTGFAVRAGLSAHTLVGSRGITIQQAWIAGAEPYFGVALHGFPNYFTSSGPDFGASVRHIIECLQLMGRHPRIEVRRSSQQVFNERVHLHSPSSAPVASAFDVSSSSTRDDVYDGPATLTSAGTSQQVRVRLAGHLNPIDGQYHWQGIILDEMVADLMTSTRTVALSVGTLSASARITEKTPQGTHSIAGVGAPPFSRTGAELAALQR